ncbi:hypothetical protein KL938_004987 [Ogataea parapolymorpha]|nr:hypothetical protein KL938_004987 [Ogataea parapolymorpha]
MSGLKGETKGEFVKLGDFSVYKSGNDTKRILVIFTDIYGYKTNNVDLIADKFADNLGYQVLIPDLFDEDPVVPNQTDLGEWLGRHSPVQTGPIAKAFLEYVKKTYDPAYLCTIGYCYGAKLVFQNATKDSIPNVCAMAHPSFTEESDLENLARPLLLSLAERDELFSDEMRNKAAEILRKNNIRHQIDIYSGTSHGFSIRGDLSDPVVKYAVEKSVLDQSYWFKSLEPEYVKN